MSRTWIAKKAYVWAKIYKGMTAIIYRMLLHSESDQPFSEAEASEFEAIIAAAGNDGQLRYDSAYPKYRFIDYVVQRHNMVAHGTNQMNIEEFENRRQTLFDGKLADAVFTSRDGIWAIFYAILDRDKLAGNFRNGCFKSPKNERYYFFSLTKTTLDRQPWTSGSVYFLPSQPFVRLSKGRTYFDEWTCNHPVKPVYRLTVNPDDFGMFDRVAIHKPDESMVKTWLLYKLRITFRRGKANNN